MAKTNAAPAALAAELWTSFTSLLESHAMMHSMAQPQARLRATVARGMVDLLGPDGRLTILAPDASGAAAMEFRPEDGERGDVYSALFFDEEGRIHLDTAGDRTPESEGMEMEAAVEHLLKTVSR